jgi:hypothetical protein
MATTFDNKANILADLWLNYRDDDEFTDFVSYNDIGLPLAYVISNGIVETTEVATRFIDETFDLMLAGLGVEDSEEGFELIEDVFEAAAD